MTVENQSIPNPELVKQHESIFVVTSTYYPNWNDSSDDISTITNSEQLRGCLALEMLRKAKLDGFTIVVVDGGSSEEFRKKIHDEQIFITDQDRKGMSAGRQQGFTIAGQNDNCQAIAWLEPEKIDLISYLESLCRPILEKEADIVIPKRSQNSWASYPDYQVPYEQRANMLWNKVISSRNLAPKDKESLDVWFGPRIFRNTPELLEIFTREYSYDYDRTSSIKIHSIVRPDLWANATFLPVISALHHGYTVQSVEIDYQHPAEQKELEQAQAQTGNFQRKREQQLHGIITASTQLIKYLTGDPNTKSKLH